MRYIFLITILLQLNLMAREIFYEDFEDPNWLTNRAWEANSIDQAMAPSHNSYSAKISASGDYLITPSLKKLCNLNLKFYPTNPDVELVIEISTQKGDFDILTGSPFTGTEDCFNNIDISLPENTLQVRFSKNLTGSIYIDDLVLTDTTPSVKSLDTTAKKLKYGTNSNSIYIMELTNWSSQDSTLEELNLITAGTYRLSDLTDSCFTVYVSNDQIVSTDDTAIALANKVESGMPINFQNLGLPVTAGDSKFIIITVNLSHTSETVTGDYTIGLIPSTESATLFSGELIFYEDLQDGIALPIWSRMAITDGFNDGNLAGEVSWTGDNSDFTVKLPPSTGNGSVSNHSSYCLSSLASGGKKVIKTPSGAAYGTWEFFIADGMGWSLSSLNKYSVILMSDTNDIEKMRYDSEQFNGYFLENDGTFKLCRQDGANKTVILETNLPVEGDNANKNSGYSVKVKRSNTGLWELYINESAATRATTLVGSVTDNSWTDSESFAVRTEVNSPSDFRVVYFDSLTISETEPTTLTSVLDMQFYLETVDGTTTINWRKEGDVQVLKFSIWTLNDGVWSLWNSFSGNKFYYAYDITGMDVDQWLLTVNIEGEDAPLRIPCTDGKVINCSVTLNRGWNLLGTSDRPEFIQMLKNHVGGQFWRWQDNSYQITHNPQNNEAFWFYSEYDQTLTFNTNKKTSKIPEFSNGWNMVSFPAELSDPETLNQLVIFEYTAQNYEECHESQITPLTGYWVFKKPEN